MGIEMVADHRCQCGEGPLWHPGEQRLYWCDIEPGQLFRYDPDAGETELVYEGESIGGFTIEADGSLLLFQEAGTVRNLRDDRIETVLESIPAERGTRFNDVIADPSGRVLAGTMPTNERGGRLYRVETDMSYTVLLDDVAVPNGLGFTLENDQLYFTESDASTIHRYEYDVAAGTLGDHETFVDRRSEDGVPDGMTVDSAGFVWSALWNGQSVVRYAPDGTVDRTVELPAERVTSVTFGDPDFDALYVTTAGGDNRDEEGPGAGALFRLETDVPGRPEYRSRVS